MEEPRDKVQDSLFYFGGINSFCACDANHASFAPKTKARFFSFFVEYNSFCTFSKANLERSFAELAAILQVATRDFII